MNHNTRPNYDNRDRPPQAIVLGLKLGIVVQQRPQLAESSACRLNGLGALGEAESDTVGGPRTTVGESGATRAL
jgi:hypothetical protein